MSVKVTIKLDKTKISNLEKASQRAFEMTVEAVLSDIKTSAVVPKDTGELERSGFVDTSQIKNMIASIVFDTPYARRLYWHPEFNFRTDKNINAQGKWMQMYLDGDKQKFIKETYMYFLKMLSKGLIK
ncbi:minor capsid protein [Clostridium sp. YIM B02506]|uniref:minor capsid protein n=1 Tax=Clostridium sp. YIM B02506 TaxID=2910680 RepID=UPI001EED954F|nr:minor capsid protein [Clostridium sp. YIM B02506]